MPKKKQDPLLPPMAMMAVEAIITTEVERIWIEIGMVIIRGRGDVRKIIKSPEAFNDPAPLL